MSKTVTIVHSVSTTILHSTQDDLKRAAWIIGLNMPCVMLKAFLITLGYIVYSLYNIHGTLFHVLLQE